MIESLKKFLAASYREKVMGMPTNASSIFSQHRDDPGFMEAVNSEINRIRAIPGDIARRDFAAYKSLQALQEELDKMNASAARQ